MGTLRFANLDTKQVVGVSGMDVYSVAEYNAFTTNVAARSSPSGGRGWFGGAKKLTAPQPEKITVSYGAVRFSDSVGTLARCVSFVRAAARMTERGRFFQPCALR